MILNIHKESKRRKKNTKSLRALAKKIGVVALS